MDWAVIRRKRRKKKRRVLPRAPELTEKQILAWADAYHERTGRWPKADTSPQLIPSSLGETWNKVEHALRKGLRGLPGGSSLARLLAKHRSVRNDKDLPPLTYQKILVWADAYYRRTGRWPTRHDGPIPEASGETWHAVQSALANGRRQLPGGSSLAQLLAEQRGRRNLMRLPPLTEEKILAWSDAYFHRTGNWPTIRSVWIASGSEETWKNIDNALLQGLRGLPGGSSLARLLAKHRGVRNRGDLPSLTYQKILTWADAYYRRTGRWPTCNDGPIPEAPGETWMAVQGALANGGRQLPGGSSLAHLLAERRGRRNHMRLTPLTKEQILAWADAFHERNGRWPMEKDGEIAAVPGESWQAINMALAKGLRGLPCGSSLARLLAKHRGVRNRGDLPPLTYKKILVWADAHYRRTGRWPTAVDGPIPETPGETWMAVQRALANGRPQLPGGSSLAQLLAERRGKRNHMGLAPLTEEQILAWADAYFHCTGTWPTLRSVWIVKGTEEVWKNIDTALLQGLRGLPGGSSLARLLAKHRSVRNEKDLPPLTYQKILSWADAYHRRMGRWPTREDGPILEAPEETWKAVQSALVNGRRQLPGGSSLAQLLTERRGKRNHMGLAPLTEEQILAWADAYFHRTGNWPTIKSVWIASGSEETWKNIDGALLKGVRGLPGGSSLARLLAKHRGVRRRRISRASPR